MQYFLLFALDDIKIEQFFFSSYNKSFVLYICVSIYIYMGKKEILALSGTIPRYIKHYFIFQNFQEMFTNFLEYWTTENLEYSIEWFQNFCIFFFKNVQTSVSSIYVYIYICVCVYITLLWEFFIHRSLSFCQFDKHRDKKNIILLFFEKCPYMKIKTNVYFCIYFTSFFWNIGNIIFFYMGKIINFSKYGK